MVKENYWRGDWPLAIVTQVFPDNKGFVRRLSLCASQSEFIRNCGKVVLLEAHDAASSDVPSSLDGIATQNDNVSASDGGGTTGDVLPDSNPSWDPGYDPSDVVLPSVSGDNKLILPSTTPRRSARILARNK